MITSVKVDNAIQELVAVPPPASVVHRLPVAFLVHSVGQLLGHETETRAVAERTQIARVSAALVAERFRQSTAFLDSIATPSLARPWDKDQKMLEAALAWCS
jgi:hypothetical protein